MQYGEPRALTPETMLLFAAAQVRLGRGAETDRARLKAAVVVARDRVHTPTERALLNAATAYLAGSGSLDALSAAELAQTAAVVPPRGKPAASAEPSLFPPNPTHAARAAMASELLEDRS
ncbi:hypothetical protein [Azospirillum sp.]|uniref:hypothetical protein n=1 Tax=Azospirillum sp. TaxID=34012 RepID=UPI003D73D388